jgi:hypothetical protein
MFKNELLKVDLSSFRIDYQMIVSLYFSCRIASNLTRDVTNFNCS